MRRLLLPVLLVLLAAARPAAAVCTAAEVMACGSQCFHCAGNTCTLAKLLTVTPPTPTGTCTFDFGARDLVLASGGFTAGQNAFEIKAHGLTVGASGTLRATGNQVTPGGTITLTLGAGGFTVLAGANLIDLTGSQDFTNPNVITGGGGTFTVMSDGDVTIGGPIAVDGTTANAQGGTICLNAGRLAGTAVVTSGSITVTAVLSATARVNGCGGTVNLGATGVAGSGRVDLENRLNVVGGGLGGLICLASSGDTVLGTTPGGGPLLVANADGDGTCGGCIAVSAGQIVGNNGVTGALHARGSDAFLFGNDGGDGGMVSLESTGPISLGGGASGGIDVTAGQGAGGGLIMLTTGDAGADLTLTAPLLASATGLDGFGGQIDLCAGGRTIVRDDIDTSSTTGCGLVCMAALSDITVDAPAGAIRADGVGGSVGLCAGGDIALGSPLLSAATTSTLGSNDGGAVSVIGARTITANGRMDVSASGPNSGGKIDLEADRDLLVGSAATLDARGGSGGGSGGTIFLLGGGIGFPGNATLNGHALANGSAPASAGSLAAGTLAGCTVHVGPTGLLDTRGDALATNTVAARTGLSVDPGGLIATTGEGPTSGNFVVLPTGVPTPSPAAFSPPLAPADVTFKPPCTGPNQPPNCLTPCPACGNGQVEYPETCDTGAANGPCQPCDQNCRTHTCDDRNACTTDTCDPLAGCSNTLIPGCTTTTVPTTTTSSSTTTSTTSSSVTTTTVIGTTSTTTVPQATSTTSTASTSSSTTTTSSSTTSSTSSTVATSSTTSTTAPPECTANTPGACDDQDRCTRDTCVAHRCVHDPLTGFDAVICRLDGITDALQGAPATAVGGSRSQHKLEKGIARARTLTVSGQAAHGKQRAKQLGKAVKKLAAFIRGVRNGRKIEPALRARLLSLANEAMSDLTPLRTAP